MLAPHCIPHIVDGYWMEPGDLHYLISLLLLHFLKWNCFLQRNNNNNKELLKMTTENKTRHARNNFLFDHNPEQDNSPMLQVYPEKCCCFQR